jgi:hypothetical protein
MALILVGQSELWERLVLQAYTAIRNASTCSASCITTIAPNRGLH